MYSRFSRLRRLCQFSLLHCFCCGIIGFSVLLIAVHNLPEPGKKCWSARGCDFVRPPKVTERSNTRSLQSNLGQIQVDLNESHFFRETMEREIKKLEDEFKKEIEAMKKIDVKTTKKTIVSQKIMEKLNSNLTIFNDGLVRNCITQDIIGMVPKEIETQEYKEVLIDKVENASVRKSSFEKVFETRAWGHSWDTQYKGLNASGMGATLLWTQEAIATLHVIITLIKHKLNIPRVMMLDVPCGDMAWMSRFLKTRDDIDYTGMDIVPDLIENHKKVFQNYPWRFILGDVVTDDLAGKYHLVFSRTLLQHLFLQDAVDLLGKFSRSGSHFVVMTTWARHPMNEELRMSSTNPGRMRRLNMEIPPFNLTPPVCISRDGPPDVYEGWDHFMGLWELPLRQTKHCGTVNEFNLLNTEVTVYSCVDWSIK